MHSYAHLGCDDACKCCLSKARRTIEQNVIQCIITFLCGTNEDLEILLDLLLTAIVIKCYRAKILLVSVIELLLPADDSLLFFKSAAELTVIHLFTSQGSSKPF